MTVRVRLLGPPRIEDEDGQPRQPPRGRKSWALLARLAMAERSLSRSELAAELYAEADDPLGALRWCLADVRRCCGDPGLARGDPVSLTAGLPWFDVRALQDGSLPVAEIGGELLAGVEPRNCPAFDMWLMLARGRCAARSMEELRQAVLRLLAAGDFEAAAEVAGRAAAGDPLDEGAQEICGGHHGNRVTEGPRTVGMRIDAAGGVEFDRSMADATAALDAIRAFMAVPGTYQITICFME